MSSDNSKTSDSLIQNERAGLIGIKVGMTQIFTPDGEMEPATVIKLGPCTVLGVRRPETHGYKAVQFGFSEKKQQRTNKPDMGSFAKVGKGAFEHIKEIRCDVDSLGFGETGKVVKADDVFKEGELVDITGTSIGRGFSGGVRRYKMKGSPSTRGTHETRRHTGAIGNRKFPGRVMKNKKMPGHMGAEQVTVRNLSVLRVHGQEDLLLVRGGIPGARGGLVVVRKAITNA